jgi:hypothetical protein
MATLAAFFRRTDVMMAAAPAAREAWHEQEEADRWRLRPLPCEDVYFFSKRIDNSRVVREADPAVERKAWKNGVKAGLATAALILLIMPKALSMVAGYSIHKLTVDHDRMVAEATVLQLEEARLVSPDRLEHLARTYGLINPDSHHVVFLNAKATDALALNVRK